MENIFIKEIINKKLINNTENIKLKGLFNYNINKIEIIEFEKNKDIDEYEYIINNNNNEITDKEQEEIKEYINNINEEIKRIHKIIEYIVTNIELLKIEIPNFKIYDYSNISKNIRNKVKTNNHQLDINKFILKNKIEDKNIKDITKELLDTNEDINLNQLKKMSIYIIIQIINIFNNYNKCLNYSKQLIEEQPEIIKNKEENLCKIDKELIKIENEEIIINHNGIIKNSYISNNKIGKYINIKKNKNKKYEISFK